MKKKNWTRTNKYQIGDFVRSKQLKSKGKIVSYRLMDDSQNSEPLYYILFGTNTGGVYLPESDLIKTASFGFHNTSDCYYKSQVQKLQQL